MMRFNSIFMIILLVTAICVQTALSGLTGILPNLPWLPNVDLPQDANRAKYEKEVSQAMETLINSKVKMCSTCDSLKFFAIKRGRNTDRPLQYLTAGCSGPVSFSAPTGASNRPGDNQMFTSTRLLDETWLLQPRNCPGSYIKATSATTLAVSSGFSSSARFWIENHENHVHIQSGLYVSSYWSTFGTVQMGPGATFYLVEYWPDRAWP